MIYPENYESKIGFNDIKALLSGFCQSELGRERVGELQMLTEVGAIRQKLQESQELETILEETVELPEMAFYDLRPSIQRIRLEGHYEPQYIAGGYYSDSRHFYRRFWDRYDD